MRHKLAGASAILLTAGASVPMGAHLFELPNRIGLPKEAYATVQGIYRGWELFGVLVAAAVLANLASAAALRGQRGPRRLALAAAALMAATFAVFFVWTRPANLATANWTRLPEDWQALRAQWEYSHAANAVLAFAALCCAVLAALAARRDDGRPAAAAGGPGPA
jgi:hypothetical protein